MLSEAEKQAVVFLAAVDGIGSVTLRRLIDWANEKQVSLASIVGKPEKCRFFGQNAKLLDGISRLKQQHSIETYWEWLASENIGILLSENPDYPSLLKQVEHHPLVLYFRGKVGVLHANKPIAVVGTRRATAYGERATQVIVSELVQHGATIVSGFMYGIDTIAHQAAIDSGGATIAVLGFGFGQMFPSSHGHLFEQMLQKQVVFISQFAPNTPASSGNFPARNRLVAGISIATVVVEAALPSGSMITANFALEEGRAVCAVPGPFDNPYSQGTKWLINQGATLVASGNDILVDAGLLSSQENLGYNSIPNNQLENLNLIQKQLVSLIAGGVRSSDELADQLKLPIEQLSFELTQLEMLGIVRREQDGWVK
ncbi:DNA-processing protein DprA [Candidatus Woesebacteria bacterium]|nr:DNA-processing protein DprA [Candidatus Woesebacteria bacterium]